MKTKLTTLLLALLAVTWTLSACAQADAPTHGGVGVVVSHEPADYGTITEVAPGSPADKAGLKVGDKVVTVDGKTMVEMPHALRGQPGTSVTVVVSRNGTTITVTLVREDLRSLGM